MLKVPAKLADVFAPFGSEELEVLASFAATVRELQGSRFGRNLEKLGHPPRITDVYRRPEGGGFGKLRMTHAAPEMRNAIFAASRRLRTESEFGSFHQACRILKSSTKRRGTDEGTALRHRLEAASRRVRDASSGTAAVAAEITDEKGKRSYTTREEVRELAEYGHHFHQGDSVLRRDWLSVPASLLDSSVDEALRAAIEAAIAIYPIAEAVLRDPALRAL
jgi:hypothetical protein